MQNFTFCRISRYLVIIQRCTIAHSNRLNATIRMSYCASLYDHWMLFRIKTDILNPSGCIHYPFGSDGLADDLNFRISDRISKPLQLAVYITEVVNTKRHKSKYNPREVVVE